MKTRRIGQAVAVGATIAAASLASANFWAPGIDNSWDANGNAMTETFGGSGIWELAVTGRAANERLLWDILSVQGDWASKVHPAGNQWGFADGAGEIVLTLDTNTYADGWSPATNRAYTDTLAAQTWVAPGNFQAAAGLGGDWDLGAAPSMTDNAGIFEYVIAGGTLGPGIYDWKPVANPLDGNWDSVGDGTGANVNAGNSQFTVVGGEAITIRFDPSNGTTQFTPTPGALALLGIGGIAATRRRRR